MGAPEDWPSGPPPLEFEFRLPGKGRVSVPCWGNFPVELAAALAGVKPATHLALQPAELPRLEALCAALGLRQRTFPLQSDGPPSVQALVGRSDEDLARAERAWYSGKNPGVELGYPACCVRRFDAWLRGRARGRSGDCVEESLRRTRSSGPFPFWMNDAFYAYSRWPEPGDAGRHAALARANPSLGAGTLNVLPWHPCAYDCAESLRLGKRVWSALLRFAPELARRARLVLPWPVLFWSWSEFAVLDGEASKRLECRYSGLRPPFSALPAETAAALSRGDRVVRSRAGLAVYAGTRRIELFRGRRPVILPFSFPARGAGTSR